MIHPVASMVAVLVTRLVLAGGLLAMLAAVVRRR